MWISSEHYKAALERKFNEGRDSILDIIRDSEKIVIVHGNFVVKGEDSSVRNTAVFVVHKNIGIKIEKDAKRTTIANNFIHAED